MIVQEVMILKTNNKDNTRPLNRIKISLTECIEVEVESEELSFEQLKIQSLDLLEVAKKSVLRTPVNKHETA